MHEYLFLRERFITKKSCSRHRIGLSAPCMLLLVACMALCYLPTPVQAQSQATTGVIRGFVSDQFVNPIAGATVTLKETRTNFERVLTTSAGGTFAATLLPLGIYEVTVSAEGFTDYQQSGIPVRVGASVQLPITLVTELGNVVVTAEAPAVDPTQSETSTRLPEDAVEGLPNNGRNFLNLTLLTPGVAIVQGPDGDELSIAGQRGIHNNVSVDGADFNNPFFGEQRGGQRPAFTFNLDAVQELVVVPQGANAEFGRSSGGFINVITKSGTNDFDGTVHYFGKFDALAANSSHTFDDGTTLEREPDFSQHQFGFTLGGPIIKDKLFFFSALDWQEFSDTKQTDPGRIDQRLRDFMDTAFGGALANDYGPIDRTNDARAFLLKLDYRLSNKHYASIKYNHTFSEQVNGTFDVDPWARSANALEKDWSNAVSGSLNSILSSNLTNEFRFQYSREDRPRPYDGPTIPGTTAPPGVNDGPRPFPDTGIDFGGGYRLGLPFFIPVEYYDTRIQLLNNISYSTGNHLIKAGIEWNRVESVQTFIGFANGRFIFGSVDGFLNYVEHGNGYVECSDGSTSLTTGLGGTCPAGTDVTGPVILYLQQAGVGGTTVEQAGTQAIPQHEIGVFIQDSWQASPNLTLNYGLRWEAQIQPDPITPASEVFYAPFIGQTVNGQEFPSDGEIPSDYEMIQPRFGFAYDVQGDGRTVVRGSAGVYYARIPGLNLASSRSTNGSLGQTIFRASFLSPFGIPPPNYDELLPDPAGEPTNPDVFVFDKDFSNPRTTSFSFGGDHQFNDWGLVGSINFTHARTDNLTRFTNRNDPALGSPWSTGLGSDGSNGVGALTTVESTAKSRYTGITVGLRQTIQEDLAFQANYTISWDKSDDDNERDPFTLRYVDINQLDREYGYSDRDQRHRFNAWLIARLPYDIILNNRVSFYSAQPISESCGANNQGSGMRSVAVFGGASDRICADGSIIERNTLRKDNEFFSWDVRFTKIFQFGTNEVEANVEIFNVTNTDNFRDPAFAGLLFNFDGTVQSGLGDPRQVQVGVKYRF